MNLQSGGGKLVFEEEHKDASGNTLVIPAGFVIAIPVFAPGAERAEDGSAKIELDVIPVRLRYRVSNGRVQWTLVPHRLDLVLRDALSDAVARVRRETGVPVFEGTPEKT
ncbi:MAG: DUF2303 family protein [Candidatus Competibacteraceae bacterium]|nr:DUF2303 family protein [Candidatus Competibacteraceae bacterium]